MGLLPIFEVTAVKDAFRIPTRTEVTKELTAFLRDQAARNAVSSKCLEDIWALADKPGTGGSWTFMRWPDMTEEENPILRIQSGKNEMQIIRGGGGG